MNYPVAELSPRFLRKLGGVSRSFALEYLGNQGFQTFLS